MGNLNICPPPILGTDTDKIDQPAPRALLADTGAVVRIATWNCRSALDKKMAVVEAIDADVLIVQECTPATVLSRRDGITALWSSPYPSATKGVGVFCRVALDCPTRQCRTVSALGTARSGK